MAAVRELVGERVPAVEVQRAMAWTLRKRMHDLDERMDDSGIIYTSDEGGEDVKRQSSSSSEN